MKDCKTTRKIHLVFDQDDNGNLNLSTTEGSIKDAERGMFPQHTDQVQDMAALCMMTMNHSGTSICCIRLGDNHWQI